MMEFSAPNTSGMDIEEANTAIETWWRNHTDPNEQERTMLCTSYLEESLKLHQDILQTRETLLGNDVRTAASLFTVGFLLQKLDRPMDAIPDLEKSKEMYRCLCQSLLQGWARSAWCLYKTGLPGELYPLGNEEASVWKWEASSIAKLLRIKPKENNGRPAEKAVPTTEEDTGESTQGSLTSDTLSFFLPK